MLYKDPFLFTITINFIAGALTLIVPTVVIYRLIKKHYPNWKILITAGLVGGIIALFA